MLTRTKNFAVKTGQPRVNLKMNIPHLPSACKFTTFEKSEEI